MKKLIVLFFFNCILLNGYNQNNIKSVTVYLPNQAIEIGFVIKIEAPDLQIKKLTAYSDSDQIVFTLTYLSQKDRFLSFFTPPDGDLLKYVDWDGIKKNDTVTTFRISRSEFKSIDQITMRFSTNKNAENDRNFIFIDMTNLKLKKLLGIQ